MVRARNRRRIPTDGPELARSEEFDATERRVHRLESIIAHRQPTLAVVLEDVVDPHNASAVLRTCDAIGVIDVHLVYVAHEPPRKTFGMSTSSSASKWLNLHWHDSIGGCYAQLRSSGFTIVATALREESRELYDLDLTQPTALVFGSEKSGVSQQGIAGADATACIPMHGMVESLNISVSCAVTLYEAMRQRTVAGMYASPQMDGAAQHAMLTDWIER